MKNITFNNKFFSFLFSYNTSVHMKKVDFLQALSEFYRVLKHHGLCYINFLSEECETFGKGVQIGNGEFIHTEDNEEVLYCHYKDNEIEATLRGFEIIYKEKRIIQRIIQRKIDKKEYTSAYLDYISYICLYKCACHKFYKYTRYDFSNIVLDLTRVQS